MFFAASLPWPQCLVLLPAVTPPSFWTIPGRTETETTQSAHKRGVVRYQWSTDGDNGLHDFDAWCSAALAVSYFTTNAASSNAVQLAVGDTLLTTITFTFNGVAAQNTSEGFRLGIYEFGSNRVSADFGDSSSQGAGV